MNSMRFWIFAIVALGAAYYAGRIRQFLRVPRPEPEDPRALEFRAERRGEARPKFGVKSHG